MLTSPNYKGRGRREGNRDRGIGSLEDLQAVGVEAEEDEDEDGEGPEGGAAVAEEGEGDADDGDEADGHADVHGDVEEEDAGDAVAVDAGEVGALALGKVDEAEDEGHEEEDDGGAADESPFLADGAEDEVGAFGGDEVVFDLGAFEESLAGESPGSDGDFGLHDVVAGFSGFLFDAEEDVDAVLLVWQE